MANKKPPNPQGAPKSHGKKPKAPASHSNSGRFDHGSNNLNDGCWLTALALLGGAVTGLTALVAALGYAAKELL